MVAEDYENQALRILHANGGRRFVLNKMIKKMKILTDKKKNKQWLRYEKKMRLATGR